MTEEQKQQIEDHEHHLHRLRAMTQQPDVWRSGLSPADTQAISYTLRLLSFLTEELRQHELDAPERCAELAWRLTQTNDKPAEKAIGAGGGR